MPLITEEWININEGDGLVDTEVNVQDGQRLVFVADGTIWAGVWFTGRNGPQGWNNIANDTKFPMSNAHAYSLLGFLDDEPFEIGRGVERLYNPGTGGSSRLYLQINDDTPGNGDGAFSCRIQLWQD